MELKANIPSGPVAEKWSKHRFDMKLVNPANKRKYSVIVVGSGLAGGAAAASMAELGYNVKVFCYQDSPRRAHSIAAQGGINAAKNYQNDGDSVWRLFYDTVKGGDFRAREANVYRLAELSVNIIDQCVAQGVPFAREYGGTLANRSFGGALVSRTFYARGQTGQQLLLGAYQALMRQVGAGQVKMLSRHEMLEPILIDGRARGIVARDMVTGKLETHLADAVVLATGGYGNVFYLATYAKGCNGTAIWRAYKKGAAFANPCYTQIHPTCIPVHGEYQSKLTLMSESLRNDGRIWVPKKAGDNRPPHQIPEDERDYYLERKYPTYGNLAPRDISSRAAKQVCDEGRGVGPGGLGVYLDFADSIQRLGAAKIGEKYGNLFEMYERITDEDPYKVPMRIFPASHYTMGGLWVDYNLMSTIPGLLVGGEANFSDHGANRLGASALMQGLADGYFILPYTVGHYLASTKLEKVDESHPEARAAVAAVEERLKRLLSMNGKRTVTSFHRELGKIMWEHCGMGRNKAGLEAALQKIPALREEFWRNLNVPGSADDLNQSLEMAGRVADFLELGELMCLDALEREESCGGHFREEHQTAEGEAVRDDERFCHVAAWEHAGDGKKPIQQRRAPGVRGRAPADPELQMSGNGKSMTLTLHVWRQKNASDKGRFVTYQAKSVSPDMSFLEMLDVVNEQLTEKGEEPIAFDHDCREGICGTCSLAVNGRAHGPRTRTTACQLHMRTFRDGDTLVIEPWRAKAFPVVKDLIVDRSALDGIIAAGGFVSMQAGSAPDGNAIPVPKTDAELAMDAAACIGCGACVAACPNASAMLFTAAKVSQLALLPQGQPERYIRVRKMVAAMDEAGFGNCTNHGECEAACPKGIKLDVIARMNRDFLKATLMGAEESTGGGGA